MESLLPDHCVRHAPRLPSRDFHPAQWIDFGAPAAAAGPVVLLPAEAAVALAAAVAYRAASTEDEIDVVYLLLVRVEDVVVAFRGGLGLLVQRERAGFLCCGDG